MADQCMPITHGISNGRICKNCKVSFELIGLKGPKQYCSDECRIQWNVSRQIPKSKWRLCKNEGCANTVRARNDTWCNACYNQRRKRLSGKCSIHKCDKPAIRHNSICEMHYGRIRRNAAIFGNRILLDKYVLRSGYSMLLRKGHPICDSDGRIYEHRYVAYEWNGGVCPNCFWCDTLLNWDNAVIDHLNEKKDDNRPDNLVVSCNPCNRARGAMLPFLRRMSSNGFNKFLGTLEIMRASSS